MHYKVDIVFFDKIPVDFQRGIWCGFYNQRDVEIPIYESDEVSMNSGTGPVDEATG